MQKSFSCGSWDIGFLKNKGLFFALSSAIGLLAQTAQGRILTLPDEASSIESAEADVRSVSFIDQQVFVFLKNPKKILRVSFLPEGNSRESRFGKIVDQERLYLSGDDTSMWRAVDKVDGRYLMFDGAQLAVSELDPKSHKIVGSRAIPWDLLRPPADRGGEATRSETDETRGRFSKAMLAAPPLKFVGFARVPEAWKLKLANGMGQAYLIASRISGFPLLLMECRKDEPSQCLISRYCRLTAPLNIPPEAVSGIGIVPSSKSLIIGDASQHNLVSYKWRSCYAIDRQSESWQLPPQIKNLRGFSIDNDGRLWVASDRQDDYLNASIYFWNKW